MSENLPYRRGKFATELPCECRYTDSHYWLMEEPAGVWRVGITQFSAWLIGEPTDFALTPAPGSSIEAGQEIGWIEGLKSVHPVHAVASGVFLSSGEDMRSDVTLLDADPHGRGWIYRVRGEPAPGSMDVYAYMKVLDEAVDEVVQHRLEECGGDCAD